MLTFAQIGQKKQWVNPACTNIMNQGSGTKLLVEVTVFFMAMQTQLKKKNTPKNQFHLRMSLWNSKDYSFY